MNDIECNKMYESLISILKQGGLEWVTSQVAEQVRLGKTIEKEIETLRESNDKSAISLFPADEYPVHLKRDPRATFPVTVEYQPCERLRLLINAVEQAVVHTAEMEHHIFDYIEKEVPNLKAIQFISEEPESQPVSLERQNTIIRSESSRKLKGLLDSLCKEI